MDEFLILMSPNMFFVVVIFVNARCDSFGVDIRIPIFLFLVDYFVLTAANKADAAL